MRNKDEQIAQAWLMNEVRRIPNIALKKEIKDSITINGGIAPPMCKIVLFKYNAQMGNSFGYWDKYPLVIIVRPFEDHYFGFNLHYINREGRIKIIDTMNRIIQHGNNNRQYTFKLLYAFLDSLVKAGIAGQSYKNYKYQNMESKFVVIDPKYYGMVANLPLAQLKENKK